MLNAQTGEIAADICAATTTAVPPQPTTWGRRETLYR